METRAHHALIGLFTLAVVAAAFAFVWWFGARGDTTARMVYQVIFEGSVSGLTRGSAVLFNGIRVGEVSRLDYDPDHPNNVIATIAVDQRVPMRTDTTARLEYQGLTGVSAVMLRGGEPDAPPLAGSKENPPQIKAERSQLQDILEGARNVLARADSVVTAVDEAIRENRGSISRSIGNVEQFTQALAANSDAVGSFLASTGEAAKAITSLSSQLEGLSNDARAIVKAVDPDKVRTVVDNASAFSEALRKSAGPAEQMMTDAAALAHTLRGASASLETVIDRASAAVAAIDPAKISRTVDNVSRFSETLDRNTGAVDEIVHNAQQLSERLNRSSQRLDGLLAKADTILGETQGSGVVDEIRETAKAIRTLADNLDKRTATLSSDVSGFTGRGLRELEGLIATGRTTLGSVDRLVRDIERNPQRFLFGGGGVPNYAPRR